MKKQIIRILCVVIAVLVVAMSMPLGVFADSAPTVNGVAYLNSTIDVAYYYSTPMYYVFYPEETGIYLISSEGEMDTFVTVFDRDMNKLDSDDDGGENGNFAISLRLESKRAYYIKVGAYGSGEFTVKITMPEAATGIAVCDGSGNTVSSIYGHTGESIRYFTKLLPEGSVGDGVVWNIADKEVATVDTYGNITFKNDGSTSLTVTAGDLSTAVPVVTSAVTELIPNVENSVSIPSVGDHLCIHFTAPEAGDYAFKYSESEGLKVKVFSEGGMEYFEGEDLTGGFNLSVNAANEIFVIRVDYAECTAESFSIKAEKIIYAESMDIYADCNGEKLYCDYYNLYVGDTLQLGCEPYPENSVIIGNLTYYGSDSSVAEVTGDGTVTANKAGTVIINASSYSCSDEITVFVMEKDQITVGETYNYLLNENNFGKCVGTLSVSEDIENYKISFNATGNVNVRIFDEYGYCVTEQSGSEGVIRHGLGGPSLYQVVITSENIHEEVYCSLTVEEYTSISSVEIVDSEGVAISEYIGEVDDYFTLSCNITPENADTSIKWVSNNPEIAYVDEFGNVSLLKAGNTNVYAYAMDDNGEIIYHISDNIWIYAENITDTQFGYGHYITIEDYTEKLRVRPTHTGYYYAFTSGDDISIGVYVTNTADNSNVDIKFGYISEKEYKYSFYLEAGGEYIIGFNGPWGNGYNVSLGEYEVPNRIDITDVYGNVKTEHIGYTGDDIALSFQYDVYDAFRENSEWKSSDESVATVDAGGYVQFLKAGTATITVTTETGLTAKLELTVIDGKKIELDTPVTETLSYDGNDSVRFIFTPTATAVYEISAVNTAGENVSLNFSVLDSSYNEIALIENSVTTAGAKMEAGKTYFIKVYEQGMGGTYSFTLTNQTIGLDTPELLTMPEGSEYYINYYFIPEKTGFYLFKTSGYNDDGWGRGVDVYNDQWEMISAFSIDGDSSLSYVSLTAGKAYRARIFKNYWQSATFTFEITEAVGISSMEIVTMPDDSTVVEGTSNFNFSGLSLKVTTSDGNVQHWYYDESSQYICGYTFGYSNSEEIDGVRYVYIKAGGAVCEVPFTVKLLEVLAVNNPIQVTYGMEYDEIYYKFIPEKTGWYLFKSYNHQVPSEDRYMNLTWDSMWVTEGMNDLERLEMYAYLTEGEAYVVRMYKNYWESDEFTFSVTEAVGIESITVKQDPYNMTVVEGSEHNPDFSGLILTVTTSDGQTRDWTYTTGADSIFGYMFETHWGQFDNMVSYTLYVGGSQVTLTYELLPYPLESIEAITAGDITIIENTNGYYMTEETYYYYDYNFTDKVRIKLNYNDGTYKFASIYDEVDGYYIGYYDSQNEKPWVKDGENYFTVTFRDKTLEIPVKIVENNVQSMEVIDDGDFTVIEGMGDYYTLMGGTESIWYYQLDYSKVKIKINFTDGSSVIASPGDEVRGMRLDYYESQEVNPIEAGKENYITVNYGEASVNLPVEVLDNGIESVSLTKTPEKPYVYGDRFHGEFLGDGYWLSTQMSDGYEFTVKYDDGSVVTVTDADLENAEYSGAQPTVHIVDEFAVIGQNKAIFAWGGTVIEFYIEVVESDVASIEVLETPTVPENLEYFPDMVGLKLLITYTDNTTKTVTLTEDNINYNGDSNIIYYADVDGESLMIRETDNGYRIDYKGVSEYFTIENVSNFYTYGITPLDFDKVNEALTIGFVYNKNGSESYKTLQIDLSNGRKYEYETGGSYSGIVKNEKGIFGYTFSYYKAYDNGPVSYYIVLLNGYSEGYLVDSAGDINGDFKIDARDLVRLKKLVAKMDVEATNSADFDGDGNDTATDLTLLRKYLLGEALLSVVYGDADGDGYLDYNDALTIAAYLAGSEEKLSSRADVNLDGVVDKKDMDQINALI